VVLFTEYWYRGTKDGDSMSKKYEVHCDGRLIGRIEEGCWLCEHQFYGGPAVRKGSPCDGCEHHSGNEGGESNFELAETVLKEDEDGS